MNRDVSQLGTTWRGGNDEEAEAEFPMILWVKKEEWILADLS
jgi:hypothetical protein